MKHLRFFSLFVAVFALFAVMVPAAAHADPPIDAEGTVAYQPPPQPVVTQRGQTVFIDVEIEGDIYGTFTGHIEERYTVVHHIKAGFNTYRGVLDFEGVVTDADGVEREGTLTLHTRGRQDPGEVFPTATPWHMSWVIVDGTGELEHVQGHGTGEIVGLDMTYTGRVHFAG